LMSLSMAMPYGLSSPRRTATIVIAWEQRVEHISFFNNGVEHAHVHGGY